jgi:8-amino-7-oxononanoate synthase
MNFFKSKLDDLKKNNLHRQPKKPVHDKISFCSNDYLCLSQNNDVKEAVINATKTYGAGSTSSRYISTNHDLNEQLEESLADLKNTDDAVIFGSGYLAGTSTIAALAQKNDLIIADKLIHSCLIDGAKLSGAKMLRFRHNDIKHAEEILTKNRDKYSKCLIITETVFSMDGDLGKVKELLELSLKFDCLMISDDAHGIGIVKINLDKLGAKNYLQMGTLSKGVGGYGGYVCGSNMMIDYLRNFAKSAIYSTALPPGTLAGNLKSIEIIKKDTTLAKKALQNANYFCELMDINEAKSCIVVVIIGDAQETVDLSKQILNKGYLVSAIRPPTVEIGKSRLRITFSANDEKSDILKLATAIKELT